jgi:methylated-DNA-[protein]-cysteine S-methyltransferase
MKGLMSMGFSLFDTSIGRCGVAWGERGIRGVQLPEASEAATRRRLAGRFPDADERPPPAEVRRATRAMAALLAGEARDLSNVALDMTGVPPFHQRVYEAARRVGPGQTLSYGEIARRVGSPGAARAVGQALGKNPFAIVVPCHRVLAANGKLGGFSANGGVATKQRMLSIEARGDNDGFDPRAAVRHVREADPSLARVIDAVGPYGLRVVETHSVFSALAEAIVHQQLSTKAASTIFARVRALVPRFGARQVLALPDRKLRAAGLSRSKVLSLKDLAERTQNRELPSLSELERLDDESIVERLTEVRGIGRWSVEMLLMFRLGRPDVLPVDDFGIRKGFAIALRRRELPTRDQVERRGARWRPYRSVASWYLWRAVELERRARVEA